jgi:predicted PurR-regulated permease PerM
LLQKNTFRCHGITNMPKATAPPANHDRVEVQAAGKPSTAQGTLVVGVVAVAALYLGRDVFVPVALAILLSFVLAPLVMLLRRYRLGRVPSVVAVVMVSLTVMSGLGAVIGSQFAYLAGDLPNYETNIVAKIHSLQGAATKGGVVDRFSTLFRDLSDELAKRNDDAVNPATKAPTVAPHGVQLQAPGSVETRQSSLPPLQLAQDIAGPLLQPLATAAIVMVFLLFFLLQREDLRDRFIRLAGAQDLRRTTGGLTTPAVG